MKDRSNVSIGKPCNTCICTLAAYAKRVHERTVLVTMMRKLNYNKHIMTRLATKSNSRVHGRTQLQQSATFNYVKICPKLTATPSKYAVKRYQNVAQIGRASCRERV